MRQAGERAEPAATRKHARALAGCQSWKRPSKTTWKIEQQRRCVHLCRASKSRQEHWEVPTCTRLRRCAASTPALGAAILPRFTRACPPLKPRIGIRSESNSLDEPESAWSKHAQNSSTQLSTLLYNQELHSAGISGSLSRGRPQVRPPCFSTRAGGKCRGGGACCHTGHGSVWQVKQPRQAWGAGRARRSPCPRSRRAGPHTFNLESASRHRQGASGKHSCQLQLGGGC